LKSAKDYLESSNLEFAISTLAGLTGRLPCELRQFTTSEIAEGIEYHKKYNEELKKANGN